MNYSPNTFKYSNKQYTLTLTLHSYGPGGVSNVPSSTLNGSDISEFAYSSKLNSLLVEGRIIYLD